MNEQTSFQGSDGKLYNADTCSPLETAWHKDEIELYTLARGNYPGVKLHEQELEGMKSIGYWNAKVDQRWGLDFHRNEGIEICFLETGVLDFHLNNTVYQLEPNMLTITRPWIPHKLGNPLIGRSKLHWFIIDVQVRQPHQEWVWPDWIMLNADDLIRLTDILRRNEQPIWRVNSTIKKSFVEVSRLIKDENLQFKDSKIKILINRILIDILELFTVEKPVLSDSLIQSRRSVAMFLESLEEVLHEDWTLSRMAEVCQLGTTQFSKYCHQITNTSPSNYLTHLRLKKAKQLLKQNSDQSIVNIAFDCGFSSNQYFTKVFKRSYNCSPGEYRKMKV